MSAMTISSLQRFIPFGLIALGLVLFPSGSKAEEASHYTEAKQAFIIDHETGMVLLKKNADTQMPTSSMSKVMTMYMVFDAIESGRISLKDTFHVSEKAWRKGGSKMFVEVGDNVKIEDLVRGVIVQSGNDATIVLAEGLAANEAQFAEIMTEKAHELGATDSNFMNASGWPQEGHYSTSRDLATIAKSIIEDFPDHYHYYGEKEFTYNDITQRNRNPLIYQSIGADGLKTGHTEAAGYGLIGTGMRDGRRVIMVINGLDSTSARAKEGRRLLSWALRSFENRTLFKAGDVIRDVPVIMGDQRSVDSVVPKNIRVTVPKGKQDEIKTSVEFKTPLKAPVQKGDVVGQITIEIPETGVVKSPLMAGQGSEELGFVPRIFAKARLLLTGAPEIEPIEDVSIPPSLQN